LFVLLKLVLLDLHENDDKKREVLKAVSASLVVLPPLTTWIKYIRSQFLVLFSSSLQNILDFQFKEQLRIIKYIPLEECITTLLTARIRKLPFVYFDISCICYGFVELM
jgi:hypothetical protein